MITIANHSSPNDLILFGNDLDPFVQRVWIALELKGIPYQFISVQPEFNPPALLSITPEGLLPAISHNDFGVAESTVIIEYLEDLALGPPLFPTDPRQKALCRRWADHIHTKLVPAYYALLAATSPDALRTTRDKLQDEVSKLLGAADPNGPFFLGNTLGYVDVMVAPWMLRFSKVLRRFKNWPAPVSGSRWGRWIEAVESNEAVVRTTSAGEVYVLAYNTYVQQMASAPVGTGAMDVGGRYGLP